MGSCLSRLCSDTNSESDPPPSASHKPLLSDQQQQQQGGTSAPLAPQTPAGSGGDHEAAIGTTGRSVSGGAAISDARPTSLARHTADEGNKVGASSGGSGSAAKSLVEYEMLAFLGQGSFAEVTLARHRTTRDLFAIKKISKQRVRMEGHVEHAFTERTILASLKHPFLVALHQAFQSATHLYLVLEFAPGGDFRTLMNNVQSLQEAAAARDSAPPSFATVTSDKGSAAMTDVTATSGSMHERSHTEGSLGDTAEFTRTSSWVPPVASGRGLPLDMIYFYSVEVALALTFLHGKGFVYRDLKPENILVRRDGHIMLTDFGVAKRRSSLVTPPRAAILCPPPPVNDSTMLLPPSAKSAAEGSSNSEVVASAGSAPSQNHAGASVKPSKDFVGTREYMSPEIIAGEAHDSTTDWWSFGCWVFEMVTLRLPFVAANEYQLFQKILHGKLELGDEVLHPHSFQFSTDAAMLSRLGPDEVTEVTLRLVGALRDLLQQLLQKDPKCRLRDDAVLEHPFYTDPIWATRFSLTNVGPNSGGGATIHQHSWKEDFLCRGVRPPFVPKLRGTDDLRYFPCAVSSVALRGRSARANSLLGGHVRSRSSSAVTGVVPSDELFEFMLQAEQDFSSTGGGNPAKPAITPAAASDQVGGKRGTAFLPQYYDGSALLSDGALVQQSLSDTPAADSQTIFATEEQLQQRSGSGGDYSSDARASPTSVPLLIGVSYEDDRMLASASSSRQVLFDGFTVQRFGSGDPHAGGAQQSEFSNFTYNAARPGAAFLT